MNEFLPTLLFFVLLTQSCNGLTTIDLKSTASWRSPSRRILQDPVGPGGANARAPSRPSCEFQGPFPYVVSVRGANGKHRCVGTLITPTTVLTAASCVDPRAGLDNIATRPVLFIGGFRTDEPIDTRQTCAVSFAPGWKGGLFRETDLAVLTFIGESCVFPVPFIGEASRNGSLFLVGHGRDGPGDAPFNGIKTIANMTEIPNCKCASFLSGSLKLQSHERCFKSPDCDCAAACEGDEGAPIISIGNFRDFTDRIVAVVSYTQGVCTSPNSAAVGTDLNLFKSWIEDAISATRCLEAGL